MKTPEYSFATNAMNENEEEEELSDRCQLEILCQNKLI